MYSCNPYDKKKRNCNPSFDQLTLADFMLQIGNTKYMNMKTKKVILTLKSTFFIYVIIFSKSSPKLVSHAFNQKCLSASKKEKKPANEKRRISTAA